MGRLNSSKLQSLQFGFDSLEDACVRKNLFQILSCLLFLKLFLLTQLSFHFLHKVGSPE